MKKRYRAIWFLAVRFVVGATPVFAQPTADTSSTAKSGNGARPVAAVSLDLPRLKSPRGASDSRPIARSRVSVDDLSPHGISGARTAVKREVSYLVLDAARDFSRPIRGGARDTTFVSFLAFASEGSVIEVAGARVAIGIASGHPGFAQISVEDVTANGREWRTLGELVKIEQHDGAGVAALPVLTMRLDPAKRVWDLYSFGRLVAEDLPLSAINGNERRFTLHAGSAGALLCSLVCADENPLFVDVNANGIDDSFERQRRLVLLDNESNAEDRVKLAREWKEHQATIGVRPWRVRRPPADNQ